MPDDGDRLPEEDEGDPSSDRILVPANICARAPPLITAT